MHEVKRESSSLDQRTRLVEYLEPVAALLREGRASDVGEGLEDRAVQAVIARLENRRAVCELLMRAWYPYRMQVVAVEELNAIAAGHDRSAWNIEIAVEDGEYFIVDLSSVNTSRARSGFGEYDDAALVRFVETNMEYEGSKVLVVIDRRVKVVEGAFPRFCEFMRKHGIEVFDKGKYGRLGGKE